VGEIVGGALQLSPLAVQIRQIVERGCVTGVHVESTLQQLFNFRFVLGHCGEVVPGNDVGRPQSDGLLLFLREEEDGQRFMEYGGYKFLLLENYSQDAVEFKVPCHEKKR
jgi:hypothetical protein